MRSIFLFFILMGCVIQGVLAGEERSSWMVVAASSPDVPAWTALKLKKAKLYGEYGRLPNAYLLGGMISKPFVTVNVRREWFDWDYNLTIEPVEGETEEVSAVKAMLGGLLSREGKGFVGFEIPMPFNEYGPVGCPTCVHWQNTYVREFPVLSLNGYVTKTEPEKRYIALTNVGLARLKELHLIDEGDAAARSLKENATWREISAVWQDVFLKEIKDSKVDYESSVGVLLITVPSSRDKELEGWFDGALGCGLTMN